MSFLDILLLKAPAQQLRIRITIIFHDGIRDMNNFPAVVHSGQLEKVDAAMTEGCSEIKFIRCPDTGQRPVNFNAAENDPLIINVRVRSPDCGGSR